MTLDAGKVKQVVAEAILACVENQRRDSEVGQTFMD
jgi:hypothetical protein